MQFRLIAVFIISFLFTSFSTSANDEVSSFGAALRAAQANPEISLSMQIRCTDDQGIRSMMIYSSGVVIWNRESQTRISTGDRSVLLNLLLKAEFQAFEDSYGGKLKSEKTGAPIIALCSISVQADDLEKDSYQDANGMRSEAFMALASGLLDHVEPLAAGGVSATSLNDGLTKIANGVLAPEALSLRLLFVPRDTDLMGTIMDVESGRSSRRDYRPGVKVGERLVSELTAASLNTLVSKLINAGFPGFPANLSTSDTYQLQVQVLKFEHTVRAREFGGEIPADLNDVAQQFISLANALLAPE